MKSSRFWLLCFVLPVSVPCASSYADESDATGLVNGQMEQAGDGGLPASWSFIANPKQQQKAALDTTSPFAGEHAALLDCTAGGNELANLMQSFSAQGYEGQRLRFRAAVRTAELAKNTRVQLWFRVDRQSGMGGFDNMQDRPISSDVWQHYDIVLDVADDAAKLNVGMFIIGKGKAWIDDATIEIVDEETETTSMVNAEVYAAADNAPQQPLLTPWLWLVLVTFILFGLSQVEPGRLHADEDDEEVGDESPRPLHWIPKYALHFSVIYWVLYSFPVDWAQSISSFTATNVLGIEEPLVFRPNGSGDTTYAYVKVLVGFLLALSLALVWSCVDRRATDGRITKDLLRTWLRMTLALTMVGYGLAKAGYVSNQFPIPGDTRLAQTYGDSSPMGLLWTFMGASRAYTIFAGFGEVLGGVLLLFRRTTTLGAMVVCGVMLNVMMLNFCYDVPVKQYSAHLLVMAVFLLLPEFGRLFNLLVLNRPTQPIPLAPCYQHVAAVWVHRIFEFCFVLLVAYLIGTHAINEVQHARTTKQTPVAEKLLMQRGFRWINEIPYNR